MTGIGKIDKPDAALYKDKKKIYFVRNIYLPVNAPDKYKDIFFRYWSEVDEHISKLEVAGKVSKVFCESIYMTGEEAMKVVNAMNVRLEQIIQKKVDAGAEFLPLEDKEIFGAYIDWTNCLMVVRTSKVYEIVHHHFQEAIKKRFDHIGSLLGDAVKDGEAALLIMRDEDRQHIHLPDDIELFFVTPPSYDDLQHYISESKEGKEFWRS